MKRKSQRGIAVLPIILVGGVVLYFGTDVLAPKIKHGCQKIVHVFKRGVHHVVIKPEAQ